MLTCSKCKKEGFNGLFNKNKSSKTGYSNWCRSCFKLDRDSKSQVTLEDAHKFHANMEASGEIFTCKKCHTSSTAKDFYFKRDNGTVRITTSMCRPCNHNLSRLKTYGITEEQFNGMLEEQNHCCDICEITHIAYKKKFNKSFAVDHDHKTGKVRALLCEWCNKGLGHFYDNPDLLRKAATYLEIKI
jgi:hypothetical protein